MRGKIYNNVKETDIIKAIAVLAVIWQGVLNYAVKQPITQGESIASTIIFNLVKFSAPAFIFAICFDLSRVKGISYKNQISHKAKELLIPYFAWSTVYMLTISNFTTISEYIQGYAFGTGAGHLWYTVMMFQFQLLIPIIWILHRKLNNKRSIIITLVVATSTFLIWLWIYNKYSLNLSNNKILLYTDRLFISYSIYGILGVVASATYDKWKELIYNGRYIIMIFFALAFAWINYQVLNQEFLEKVNLHNIIYLKPSMFLYNVVTILVLYLIAITLIKKSATVLPIIKFISTYAFRAYLANSFCVNIVGKLLGDISFGLNLIILFILTTILSFSITFGIEWFGKWVKDMIIISKTKVSSIMEGY